MRMNHHLSPAEQANYREVSGQMAGATLVPKRIKCCRCGKHRNSQTGIVFSSGEFVCHHCGKAGK